MSAVFTPAIAETSVKTVLYNVYGNTARELQESMRRNGPNGYAAQTAAQTRTNFDVESLGGKSRLKNIQIHVSIVKTMPRWVGYRRAGKCLRNSWNRMYNNLLRHENVHVGMYKQLEGQALNRLRGMGAKSSFTAVQQSVKRRVAEVTESVTVANRAFDRKTGHGLNDPRYPVRLQACRR